MEVKTGGASDVKHDSFVLNGEVTDLDDNDAVLAYFRYGKSENGLRYQHKTDYPVFLTDPANFSIYQPYVSDNKKYYFKAAVEEWKGTQKQFEYILKSNYDWIKEDNNLNVSHFLKYIHNNNKIDNIKLFGSRIIQNRLLEYEEDENFLHELFDEVREDSGTISLNNSTDSFGTTVRCFRLAVSGHDRPYVQVTVPVNYNYITLDYSFGGRSDHQPYVRLNGDVVHGNDGSSISGPKTWDVSNIEELTIRVGYSSNGSSFSRNGHFYWWDLHNKEDKWEQSAESI